MIFKRFAANLRAQNWSAIAIEFAIVVAGVFVGTWVANLNQDRVQDGETRRLLVQIKPDLKDIADNFDRGAVYYATTRHYGDIALAGYRFGPVVINAALFVPQSRNRLFMIGIREDVDIDEALLAPGPMDSFHTRALRSAVAKLPSALRKAVLWLNLPTPPHRNSTFADIIEDNPDSIEWHTPAETKRLLQLMTPINLAKVTAAKRAERRMVGGVYRRTRPDGTGKSVQRAEVRFDDVAGCLRTPAGGSSRQVILVVDGAKVRSRLISARETARLMGLEDDYKLPKRYNDAYHLTGDGVVVHVVEFLAHHLFESLLEHGEATQRRAA